MCKWLHVEVERHDGAAVIELSGSSGILEAAKIRKRLDALATLNVDRIILDLDHTDYVASLALAAVAAGYAKGHPGERRIQLLLAPSAALDLLARNHLTDLLAVSARPDGPSS